MREAALELLGRHMDASPEVAAAYFQHVVQATLDVGVSVRKRAVRILWDCCIRCSPAGVVPVCVCRPQSCNQRTASEGCTKLHICAAHF